MKCIQTLQSFRMVEIRIEKKISLIICIFIIEIIIKLPPLPKKGLTHRLEN